MTNSILEKDLKGLLFEKEIILYVTYLNSDQVKPRFELEVVIDEKEIFTIKTWEGYRKQYSSFESLLSWASKNNIHKVILKPITL